MLHETTEKEMSKWQREVFIMPADLQSESELIHYLASKPNKWIKPDSLAYRAQTRPVWGWCPASDTGREAARKAAIWHVCGAVGRREPYNLTLESKTYYTQNYDTMR